MMVPVERLDLRSFRFSDFDIIHTNGIRPDLLAFIYRRKIKYHISTIHNFVFEDLAFTYNRLISRLFGNFWLILWKRPDKLVCVSQTMKNYYSKWFPLSRLEIIHNGIAGTDNSFLPEKDVIQAIDSFRSKGLKVIGNAGILTKRKGIDQLLYLIAEEKGFALVIIGDGNELVNLQSLVTKLKISDRCLFCGFKTHAVNYFRYFDFLIVPSRSEGFGLVLIEAVQQKVPVICSDIEVFRELFNPDEVTFFKLEDRSSLTAALKMAKEIGNKKASLAFPRYMHYYTSKQMADHYYELYRSVT